MSRYFRPLFTKPKKAPKAKRFRFLGVLSRAFKRVLMLLGLSMLIFMLTTGVMAVKTLSQMHQPLPEEFVLAWSLDEGLIEHQNQRSPYDFANETIVLHDLIEALGAAAQDERVKGLVVKLNGGHLGLSHIQELAPAIKAFRASGRFAYIYATSYGQPGTSGLGSYYLASLFDQIWMQPIGVVSLAGINAEMPFARGALDKIGVEPQFFARKEYKNVFESFTSEEMSVETKTMMGALIADLATQFTDEIAKERQLDERELYKMVNQGFLTDQEALEKGLVTHLGDVAALRDAIKEAVTGEKDSDDGELYVGVGRYIAGRINDPAMGTPTAAKDDADTTNAGVALIYAAGVIVSESEVAQMGAQAGPLGGGQAPMVAGDVVDDIMDAAEDDSIKTIILRIDSPGGSPVASETVRMALVRAQTMDKQVIISMGATAASGGYWIAAPADRIFALPGTLTGSIGVAGGKFVMEELWNKVGVNWGSIQYGDNADIWSMNKPFSKAGEAHMNAMMDTIYEAFIARVSEGRGMSAEEADAVARGRVWTGQQALDVGLVDELGGVNAALNYVAAEQGLESREALHVAVYPRAKTQVEMLMELLSGQVKMAEFASQLQILQPVFKALNTAQLQSRYTTYQPLASTIKP